MIDEGQSRYEVRDVSTWEDDSHLWAVVDFVSKAIVSKPTPSRDTAECWKLYFTARQDQRNKPPTPTTKDFVRAIPK